MVDDHSEFDLATAPGLLVHSNFQRVFSIEVPCLSLESPILHCKKGKFNFKRYQSSQSEFATGSRRCSGVLEDRSWWVVHSFSLISQKSRNSDAFRRIHVGKPDTSCQVVLVYSSHFVDRDQVANGRGAVCDGAKFRYKSLKNEINGAAYHSNHGKYSFGSVIFEYSRIFKQFVFNPT